MFLRPSKAFRKIFLIINLVRSESVETNFYPFIFSRTQFTDVETTVCLTTELGSSS